jgi:hypothetical protein
MIGWRARVHQQCDAVLSVTYITQNGVTPEHAGALPNRSRSAGRDRRGAGRCRCSGCHARPPTCRRSDQAARGHGSSARGCDSGGHPTPAATTSRSRPLPRGRWDGTAGHQHPIPGALAGRHALPATWAMTAVSGDPARHPRVRKPPNDAMDRAWNTRLGAGPDRDGARSGLCRPAVTPVMLRHGRPFRMADPAPISAARRASSAERRSRSVRRNAGPTASCRLYHGYSFPGGADPAHPERRLS